MKIKYIVSLLIIGLALIGSVNGINKVSAQATNNASNIQYPVKELGNCKSDTDCRAYCDKPENTDACLNFAQKNNIMTAQEIDTAKKFLAAKNTPGGCVGKDACDTYCSDISHINECVPFAEKNNLLSGDQLQEAKKMQAAIASGVKPPACKNKKECDVYCEDPSHMEECITFGQAAGFLQGKELEDAQKMLQAIKNGATPPPCKGKDACDVYCSNPDNMEVCMNFAIQAGMMSDQEKADSQKMLQALKKGIKPPNCRGKEACDAYCSSEEHFQECVDFSVAAGMMTEDEAKMASKTGGKGPGGCVGKDACDAFCNNSGNQETCFNFAKDNGMIPEADLKRMEEGKAQMQKTLQQAPAEVIDCLNTEIGTDMVEKMKNGVMPSKDIGDKMQTCFQKMGPPQPGEPGEGGMILPAGQTGPGGCKTADECQTYCGAHQEECKNFGGGDKNGPGDFQPGPGQGEAPCKTPEECQKLCSENPDKCPKSYQPPAENAPSNESNKMMQKQTGPGGCQSEQECQAYCQAHPQECGAPLPGTMMQRCEGENCQGPPNELLPERELQPGQNIQSPPPTGPGSGGDLTPGDMVPQLQPEGQQTQQPPAGENPPPPPPPISFINADSLIGSLIDAVFKFLTNR